VNFKFSRAKSWAFWFLPILLCTGLFFLIINGYQEIGKIRQLAQKRETLILDNQKFKWKNEEMFREISRLKHDPIYLEEIARREFGLVKPDEIVFFLDEGRTKEAQRNVTNTHFKQQ
jgi:cell division protein FtsB